MVDILSVRKIIDIFEDTELKDEVIQNAIDDATIIINALPGSGGAPSALLDLAIRYKAAYFSYRSYSDRAQNVPRGAVDAQGIFKPRTRIFVRETQVKLDELKKMSDELIGLLTNYPAIATVPELVTATDSADYPDEFKMNDAIKEPGWNSWDE